MDKSAIISIIVKLQLIQEITWDDIEAINNWLPPYDYATNIAEYPSGTYYTIFVKDYNISDHNSIVTTNPLKFANGLTKLIEIL